MLIGWVATAAAFGLLFTALVIVKVLAVSWSTAASVVLSVIVDALARVVGFARETAFPNRKRAIDKKAVSGADRHGNSGMS